MKALSLLKLWRKYGGRWNEGDGVNEDSSSDLALVSAGPQLDFDKFVMKNNSSILINASVGITSFDNDTNRHSVHTNLSKRVDAPKPTAFNIFSIKTSNLESQSPLLILQSSPNFCVSMLGFKKSDQKTEFHCMTTSKTTTEDSKRFDNMKFSVQEVENSSSSKYLKLIKPLYVKASKIKIFANGEKQAAANGNRPAVVFREVCKNLMKSKSSVRTVPVAVQRRDDSAVQQQDGIQSAILHCKRSYSSSSSSTISQECTVLSRSASESSNQKATINPQVGGV